MTAVDGVKQVVLDFLRSLHGRSLNVFCEELDVLLDGAILMIEERLPLLDVLLEEHEAEAHAQQQAGQPDGPACHGEQGHAADACAQREQEDDGEVVHRLAEGLGVAHVAAVPCGETCSVLCDGLMHEASHQLVGVAATLVDFQS